jgi:hypothetical protein
MYMAKLILRRSFLLLVIVAAASVAIAQSPQIKSVSKISTQQYQTITIRGSGFGSFGETLPYTGDSNCISLEDQTNFWQAGYLPSGNTVTLIVIKWTNSEIVLGGFSGAWGEPNGESTFTLAIGDSVQIEVWNCLSGTAGNGPASWNAKVIGAKTTTTLTSSPNPSTYGEMVTFTAVVTSADGAAPPDGETISFMKGKTVLGTGILSGGSATFQISTLKVGTTTVTAVYSGDSVYDASKSKPVKQVVDE